MAETQYFQHLRLKVVVRVKAVTLYFSADLVKSVPKPVQKQFLLGFNLFDCQLLLACIAVIGSYLKLLSLDKSVLAHLAVEERSYLAIALLDMEECCFGKLFVLFLQFCQGFGVYLSQTVPADHFVVLEVVVFVVGQEGTYLFDVKLLVDLVLDG